MPNINAHERDYVAWQNRAHRFYAAARLLYRNELYGPAAYSASVSIELLLKATLVYWDRSFKPLDAGHGMAKLSRMVRNKAKDAKLFSVPSYFYFQQRYLNVSRYPTKGQGVYNSASFLDDLDNVFVDLVLLVPFQHNTELKRSLSGRRRSVLIAIRHKNQQMRRLRRFLQGRTE